MALLSSAVSQAFDTSTTTAANSQLSRQGDSKSRSPAALLSELFPNRSLERPSQSPN